jgi:hypothetical protein
MQPFQEPSSGSPTLYQHPPQFPPHRLQLPLAICIHQAELAHRAEAHLPAPPRPRSRQGADAVPRRLADGASTPTQLLATMAVGTQLTRLDRMREASPDARNGPIQGGRRAWGSAAGAGGGMGWGARGRGVARTTNRLLVSESLSKGAEGVGYQSGPLASCAASPLQFAT